MMPNLCSDYFYSEIDEQGLVPKEALQDKKRQQICLSNIQLTYITPLICELKYLKVCHLASNHLKELPNEFFDLQCLEHLDVSRNQFIAISHWINRLNQLVLLDFSFNEISTLPDELCQLPSLRILKLSTNRLVHLSEQICKLTNLRELRLRDNQLACLPHSIGGLTALEILQLKHNQLSTLPREVGQLRKLEWLNLSQNALKELPQELGLIKSIKYLSLKHNLRLLELPYTMIQWRRTVVVKLEDQTMRNQLNRKTPMRLQTLRELVASRVFSMLSQVNLGIIPQDILDYLRDRNASFYCRTCDRHGEKVVWHFGEPAKIVRRWAKLFNNQRLILPFGFHYCQRCYQKATH